ncbi:MAG: Eco47II family restriction endonuclease [Synergistaceae bacterium]|nr:Eco47II family restriction endonuclease [Synergistaceae bacterium]
MWPLKFISEKNFKKHVRDTIQNYGDKLKSFNLERFNSNIVDPIKLIFDRAVYKYTWDEIIKNEIFRQRDKSNNNDIGYFHQKIFQYIRGCVVPRSGWDVIFSSENKIEIPECDIVKTIYVEMKNKHNTLNSSASAKTYMKMQGQLLKDDDCACFLVEAIAKRSQNIAWTVSLDGIRQKHRRIRRVSMDKFYEIVTGERDAFYKMCMVLPDIVEEIVDELENISVPDDTVINEIKTIAKNKNISFVMALYMLGFETYSGF